MLDAVLRTVYFHTVYFRIVFCCAVTSLSLSLSVHQLNQSILAASNSGLEK